MNKRILKTAIIISFLLLVIAAGMCVTNDYNFSVKNFLVDGIISAIIVMLFATISSVAEELVLVLPKELLEDYEDYEELIPSKTQKELEDLISFKNLVAPMSDDEFYKFLSKDKYGGDTPDKEAILNLLEQLKGNPEYESKEKLIYKKLQEIKE